jgi:hypothetical protein
VLGEVGDDPARFATPNALQCSAGTAPVTKASGRVRVVAARFACNRFLRQALLTWALCSLRVSPWARAAYDRHRQAGKAHNAALRAVANRWLEVLHHRLATGQRYDEATHQRTRARASGEAAACLGRRRLGGTRFDVPRERSHRFRRLPSSTPHGTPRGGS